jgi:hypothetical protein
MNLSRNETQPFSLFPSCLLDLRLIFWGVMLCSSGRDRRFEGTYPIHLQGLCRWPSTKLCGFTAQKMALFDPASVSEPLHRYEDTEQVSLAVPLVGAFIREVLRSNPGRATSYPYWGFSQFSSVPPRNCRDSISISPLLLPSKSFPIHDSSPIPRIVWATDSVLI